MAGIRKVVRIDEEKCDGCGVCVPACAEGAIQVIDGKARLVSEVYCDGLGACLGKCPRDAITIEERQAEEFDEAAVESHLVSLESEKQLKPAAGRPRSGGCPGSLSRMFPAGPAGDEVKAEEPGGEIISRLGNWPVQLNLAPLQAPYFDGATVLICADCVPFALAGFHRRFLAGKTLLIGCPKLDDADYYLEKLTGIFSRNDIRAVEVLIMEVPCCSGLAHIVRQAVDRSGKSLPVTMFRIGIRGDVLDKIEAAPSAV